MIERGVSRADTMMLLRRRVFGTGCMRRLLGKKWRSHAAGEGERQRQD